MGKLYEYAILYTPIQTKDQLERGEQPKTVILGGGGVKTIVAGSDKEAQMLAARDIPADYTDKLDRIEIAMRPF